MRYRTVWQEPRKVDMPVGTGVGSRSRKGQSTGLKPIKAMFWVPVSQIAGQASKANNAAAAATFSEPKD